MPGVSRTQRAEAKYNVILDFPNLGLHSAASSGDLGLATYALDHGQPVHSVIDGVLPLHVASSGGHELIVRLLIERGADVNAPRLPRKYSSDKHRDNSAPIVGSSGATPLHFAAANGHENVVRILLKHGANPDRADKHGVTPEFLARQNGWTRCADLLSKWTHEKDRDLRERETLDQPVPGPENMSHLDSLECKVFEKKVKVKRSIDNAINKFRPTLPTPPSASQLMQDASYTTSPPPIAGAAPVQYSPDTSIAEELPPRRPSLPHIFDSAPSVHSQSPSQSSSSTYRHHPKSSGRPSFSSSRRPRSAGTDAEPSSISASASTSNQGRLRGKISLLHMFKKAAGESAASSPGAPTTPESRDSLSGYASSSSALTSASASPAPERDRSRGSSAHSPLRTRASESGSLSTASGVPYPPALTTVPSSRSQSSTSETPYPPLAVELHRRLSAERLRTRSGSGSSANETSAKTHSPSPKALPLPQLQGHRSPPLRPGILRPHARTTSSGQSQLSPPSQLSDGPPGSARSLRFEGSSAATATALSMRRSGADLDLRASESVSSLRGEGQILSGSPRSPWKASSRQRLADTNPNGGDAAVSRRRQAMIADDDDIDEDGYGEVISPRIGIGLGLALTDGNSKSRLNEIKSEERQLRRHPSVSSQVSRESSTDESLPSPTAAAAAPESGFECPFSINLPPPQSLSHPADGLQASQASGSPERTRSNLLGIHGVDNRGRGDSFGSMSTSTDVSMPQTPAPGPGLGLQIRSPDVVSLDLPLALEEREEEEEKEKARRRADSSASGTGSGYFDERGSGTGTVAHHARSRTMSPRMGGRSIPLDIDIRAISSHAQAEALVQRAQKSILDMETEDVDVELAGVGLGPGQGGGGGGSATSSGSVLGVGGGGVSGGRTPLSAKLAAYGESLAIERRFKEREQRERAPKSAGSRVSPVGDAPTGERESPLRPRRSESGVRKYSLDERPSGSAPRRGKPRRPHTADGETSDASTGFLSAGSRQISPGHKQSLSSSVLVSSHKSSGSDQNVFHRPPPSSRTHPLITPPTLAHTSPRIVRSRTPDPDRLSLEDLMAPREGTFGVPLSRVSTAPPRHASPDIPTERTMSEQERERARANKLMKMGLLAHDSFPRARAQSPYGHARNGGGSGGGGGVGGGAVRPRFGGIRGLVQTLKGKT